MIENLTKENFWNEMQEKYPKAMKKFCDWIDKYKEENNWATMFGHVDYKKYHDLPIAMQYGIFLQFYIEIINIQMYLVIDSEMHEFPLIGIKGHIEQVLKKLNE